VSLYWVGYVEGGSGRGPNGRRWFLGPFRAVIPVEAPSRADAYVEAYRELARRGGDVTCLTADNGVPLGFTATEARRIVAAGVPLEPGLPQAGVQIERIVRVEGPPGSRRADLRLPQVSGIVLSSAEDEIHGLWVIFYAWEHPDGDSICIPFTERDVAEPVARAREAAAREGRRFDIEEERRRAADAIVARELRRYVMPLDAAG
jgi:hypothetical protein